MRHLLLAIVFATPVLLFAQKAEKALEQFSETCPQEKVVLSFSKPEYLAGETIAYKAYVLNGYQPSGISTNLYAELYDKEKHLLDKEIIPLVKGSGEGSFALPASLAEDVYYVRAYTRWMLNFPESLQYLRPLHVYNPYSSQSLRPKPVQWTARAFPESGSLVEGVPANIAVRLYASGTLPPSWSGQVREKESGAVIGGVTVYNNEIGQVRFVPEAGKTYEVLLRDAAGTVQNVSLPVVAATGIVLQANVTPANLRYAILFKGIASGGKGYKLVASYNSQPAYSASFTKAAGVVNGSFDIKDLPAGVMQLTLFDEKETPVAERLCFLHQDALQTVRPAVFPDTISFLPKGHNRWSLATDSASWATYAAAVSDAALPLPDHFLSDVYLRSDFAAPLSNAAWYFENVDAARLAALDALLLTEKWQRFQWSDVLQNQLPALNFKPDKYLSYTGTVKKGKTPQPLRTVNLLMLGSDSSVGFLQVKTDNAGQFAVDNVFFLDTIKILYQPEKRKLMERDLEISFEPLNRFYPFNGPMPADELTTGPRAKNDSLPLVIKSAIAQKNTELTLAEKNRMLEAVVIKTKARNATQELEKKLSSSLFSGGDAKVFDFVNENQAAANAYQNILEWLQGRIAGYQLSYREGVPVPTIHTTIAQVFIDEMRVEPDEVSSISPSDIALIKVFPRSFVGSFGGSAAIAIYTRRGDMRQPNEAPALPGSFIVGYRKMPALPEPDYTVADNKNLTDSRVILYHRSLLPPEPGTTKTTVSFYNNDSAKSFRLLITGFTSEGNLVYSNEVIR